MNPAMLKKMKMPAAKAPSAAQAAKRSPMGEEEDILALDIEGEPDGDEAAAPSPLADISDDELLLEMKKRGLGGGKPAVSPEEDEEELV